MERRKVERITVLVVGEHRAFAEAMALAVGREAGLSARATANAQGSTGADPGREPEVVLIDLPLPGANGIERIRQVREDHPNASVIVLSAHEEDLLKARAVEAGAAGFLSDLAPFDEVLASVRRVAGG